MNSASQFLRRTPLLHAACFALLVAPASATVHTLTCQLNGTEEVPANASAGLGTAVIQVDDVANTLVIVSGSYSGLGSNATLCHVHGPAAPGTPAGIMVNLIVSGGTSGTISTGGALSPANVAAVLAGNSYLNIHTASIPAGEIRGQILLEPPGMTSFCFGDGSIATACPCVPPNTVPAPPAAAGHGCANSFDLHGGVLKASGSTSPDNVRFLAKIGPSYAAFGFMIKSTGSNPNGSQNSDGISCVAGGLVRFGGHNAGTNGVPLGLWTYPNTAQTTAVSVATAQAPATTSAYQLFYRNAFANFCTGATANFTSGVLIPWP